jgi:glycosyltransferase involved in cell wall biosynthesis
MTLSVVVPLYNEEGNVTPLVEDVRAALGDRYDWELLLVDDGSSDGTLREVATAAEAEHRIRPLVMGRQFGQTAAMQAGLEHATGDVTITMDGDRQNDPADIPRLVEKLSEGYDLVAGYRERRKDRLLTRKVPSWIANRIIHWVSGVPIRDNGCSLKAYRRELVDSIHLYSDLHRFIPALSVATVGARVAEVPVRHYPRRVGTSKYGLSRTGKVMSDLLVLTMIRWFRDHPLTLFGAGGAVAFALAVVFGVASGIMAIGMGLPYVVFGSVAALLAALGAFLVILGLLAEAAVFHAMALRAPANLILSSPGPRVTEGGGP